MKDYLPLSDKTPATLGSTWTRGVTKLRGAVGAAICSGGLLVLLTDLVAWQAG